VEASGARHACGLDTVLLVVANEPWQKTGTRTVSPAELRYEAVRAAAAGHDGLEVSRIEIDRGGPSYMIDTLRQFSGRAGAEAEGSADGAELFLIVGADTAEHLETWKDWEEVAKLAALVVINRPGVVPPILDAVWRVDHVSIPAIEVSSTDLRARLSDGRPLDFLVPDAALVLLRSSGIYPGLQEKPKFSD
jgi:nicotinate-nucleotide adenylyltransferase